MEQAARSAECSGFECWIFKVKDTWSRMHILMLNREA